MRHSVCVTWPNGASEQIDEPRLDEENRGAHSKHILYMAQQTRFEPARENLNVFQASPLEVLFPRLKSSKK